MMNLKDLEKLFVSNTVINIVPVRLVSPFNNYGLAMKLEDKRVPAILNDENIIIFSDGTPKRTYCYTADVISGYLKTLSHYEFDVFNIGIDKLKISVSKLAEICVEKGKEIFNYSGSIVYKTYHEENYLIDNPNRRCPVINKTKEKLDYNPKILLKKE